MYFMKNRHILFILCLFFSAPVYASEPCSLTMTYKNAGKLGYMAPSPNNNGFYKALYTQVAKRIGCALTIKRYPKKRSLKQLATGDVDIYPSTGFDLNRSEFMYYAPNGLVRNESYYGLSPIYTPTINTIDDIKDTHLVWVIEAGRTTIDQAKSKGITYQALVGLTAPKAIKMISWNRKVFYQIDTNDYEHYLKKHSLSDLTHLNIKVHKQCCESKSQKLYAGISRRSPIYQEEPNPHYNPSLTLSPENFPTRLVADSVGYKLSLALQDIYTSGQLSLLLEQYNIK